MKTEPLKEWLFNPACSNCVQNFHKTQKAVAWFERYCDHCLLLEKEQPTIYKKWMNDKRLKAGDWYTFLIREAFAGVEGNER